MEAVRLDVSEVLNQIMDISSKALDFKETDGYNIIQLAVINRSPKVYNLISPIIERKEDYRRMEDHRKNNLLHLAGRLAPLAVLSCTSGAALQLQRDLQWREVCHKHIMNQYDVLLSSYIQLNQLNSAGGKEAYGTYTTYTRECRL